MEPLLSAFGDVLQPFNMLMLFAGTALGLFVGAMPGLSSPMAIAVLVPLTFGMHPLPALLLLMGIYVGTKLGGSFAAILIRTPGTPAGACTALDGHPMTEQGKGGLALGYATIASTIGGLTGWVVAVTFTPLIAMIALGATNADIAMIAIVGLILVAALTQGSMVQGLIGVTLGLLIGTIGMDPISGFARLTLGLPELIGGIPFVPAMIGMFGLAVVLSDLGKIGARLRADFSSTVRLVLPKAREVARLWRSIVTGSAFGIGVGTIPGVGAEGATWMAYSTVKNQSKEPQRFGKGAPEGIMAPEAANNAVTGGTMVPMLTLGIPGDPSTAIMLGALLLHGLRPGPLLFQSSPEIAYGILAGLLFANLFMFIIAWKSISLFVSVLTRDRSWLFPYILVLAVIGSYATTNTLYAVYIALIFGLLGFVFERFGFPVAPVVLGLLLGPIIEENSRLALVLSRSDWTVFVATWPARIALIIAIFMIIREIYLGVKRWRQAREALAA